MCEVTIYTRDLSLTVDEVLQHMQSKQLDHHTNNLTILLI